MGSQRSDHQTMVGSSIALLQERFKQLERVKERREEQDLLKLFSESQYSQPKITFPTGDTLSLGINSMSKPSDFMRDIKTGTLANFRSTDMIIRSSSQDVEESDVDTSLRL